MRSIRFRRAVVLPRESRSPGPGPVRPRALALAVSALALALSPGEAAQARDSLGIFDTWAAFRDPAVPRCYAIAMPEPSAAARERQGYAAIGSWPARGERNQVHFRLSRTLGRGSRPMLAIDGQHLALAGSGSDAWSVDKRMDAAIVAAMRSARSMRISARDTGGRPFVDVYPLSGAATAMDAALLGCARG